MKKIIALALVLIMTASLPIFASAEDGVSYTTIAELINWDFETPATGNGAAGNTQGASHINVPGPDGLDDTNTVLTVPTTVWDMKSGLSGYKGVLVYEADYYMTVFNKGYTLLWLRDTAARNAIEITSTGALRLFGTDVATLSTAGWYHIYAEIDFVNQKANMTVNATIDGEPLNAEITDVAVPGTYTTLIRLYGTPASIGDNAFYVDNIKAKFTAKNYTMNAVGIDADGNDLGADGVLYDGGKIQINFSEKMNADLMQSEKFTLTNEYGRSIPFTGEFNAANNVYIITPSEDLSPRTAYTITASGLRTAAGGAAHSSEGVTCTTVGAPFSILNISEGTVTGENITYTVGIQNITGIDRNGYLIAVAYDGLMMNSVDITAVSGTTGGDYEVTLADGGDSTVFYLIESDGTFKLLDIWSE